MKQRVKGTITRRDVLKSAGAAAESAGAAAESAGAAGGHVSPACSNTSPLPRATRTLPSSTETRAPSSARVTLKRVPTTVTVVSPARTTNGGRAPRGATWQPTSPRCS